MLPPALFYVLGFVLLFFGTLRLIFLGFKAPKTTPDEERQVRTEKRGIGLLGLMGGGRMTAAKRHKVMGVLWMVLGLYVGWTGVTMSRAQQQATRGFGEREGAPVIRANVERWQGDGPTGDHRGGPSNDAANLGTRDGAASAERPTLRAAPTPTP